MLPKAIELEKAREKLLKTATCKLTENVYVEKSLGKVLAEKIYAPINVPAFRKSALDGFALRAADTRGATTQSPVKIKIIDEIPAGDTRKVSKLACGHGVKILTGAPLPPEADVVIKKEDVNFKDGEILITDELIENNNVIPVGEDMHKGELIFPEGELITPYHIGVMAALGLTDIKVYKTPKVAVFSTGSELKFPGETLKFGQIYNSNLYTVTSLIKTLGAQVCTKGNVADDIKTIESAVLQSIDKCDIILTTGGVSVGDYDFIHKTLEKIGAEILFSRVAIKPGSPVIAAVKNNKFLIGLSGNPAAAFISFELLVKPLIHKLSGYKDINTKYLEVELQEGYFKKSPQRRFLRVHVAFENGKWIARQTGKQKSSILRSMIGCNALVDIPAGSGPIAPGSLVKAVLIGGGDLTCYQP
ncbi:molybdopterin molybdotransferase [Desulfohalotomaculum tongense]|uniref:molybdopterin molybdotransferase MoeA n=1 Tax=Desulforadius tongensis TaxID=1216062 RepID=UPI001959CE73|nr:gephyrin-like molybdotransferase Glp [Desulforadius tongensis]MBM7854115.1 molybdopterin molybdotransferase [Desulforadius tongensis]